MDTKTATALEESIAHWERMATGNPTLGEMPTGPQCALCEEFAEEEGPDDPDETDCCFGCPVRDRTGVAGCEKTPFEDAHWLFRCGGISDPDFKKAAAVELEFLKSLRE